MDVGPQALPSILFHTFVNTAQSLNCSAFAPDLQAVAGEPHSELANGLQGRSDLELWHCLASDIPRLMTDAVYGMRCWGCAHCQFLAVAS